MKVRALDSDYWRKRNLNGEVIEGNIEYYKNEIYEVVSFTTVGSSTEGYTIKIGDEYGAIQKKYCEIVEGSEEDLKNSNNTNLNNIFIQCL